MISYRVFSRDSKPIVKLLHMSIQIIAFSFGVVGLHAAFEFHDANGIANMYSLHSWVGLGSFVLFSCQVYFLFTALKRSDFRTGQYLTTKK